MFFIMVQFIVSIIITFSIMIKVNNVSLIVNLRTLPSPATNWRIQVTRKTKNQGPLILKAGGYHNRSEPLNSLFFEWGLSDDCQDSYL